MSIETKTVAEFYVRLYPWIDHDRDVLVCQDDGGVGAAAIPDLCFYFHGASERMRIEFKTLDARKGGIIGCTNKQISTWSSSSNPGVAPQLWVAVERPNSYLSWRHDDPAFQQNFGSARRASKTHYHVSVPTGNRLSLVETFLQIMHYARDHRLLP